MLTLTPVRLALLAAGVASLVAGGYILGTKRAGPAREAALSELALAGPLIEVSDFSAIKGWAAHDPAPAIAAFARSCAQRAGADDGAPWNAQEALGLEGVTLGGTVADWREACAAASGPAPGDAAAARSFFETHFRPVRIAARMTAGGDPSAAATIETIGRFTAYFEPSYPASEKPTPEFSAPVLARPADLVTVDLGKFREALAGDRIAGSVSGGALEPYPDHAAINAGALDGRAETIAWMRADDLLFLQIQGSGRLELPKGAARVGYDGHNGHPYTAIGRTLIENGALTKETVSMQTIRRWLAAAPEDAARLVRESNRSYIFFRRLDNLPDPALGPLGADGSQLTPMISLAVDPRYTPLAAPVWVDIESDAGGKGAIRTLMIAQDRGGAIKGPVRGDLYAGSGDAAGAFAGAFNRRGTMTVLAPRAIADRLASARS
ncbi:MAG: murein transglycosylase A [Parvularculaceae bacterium]|nr:murein transglycosylase A [Parvularculaceae bacterium]